MALVEHNMGSSAPEVRAETERAESPGLVVFTVFRYSAWIVLGLAVGAMSGLLFGALKPNSYAAQGKLLFRTGIRESANPEFTVGEGQQRADSAAQALSTELQILRSPEIRRRVIELIGAERLLSIPDPRQGDNEQTGFALRALHAFQAWWFASGATAGESTSRQQEVAMSLLSATLQPQALYGSSVISVSYEATDRVLARDVVDAFLKACEAHHRKVFSSKSQHEFLEKEAGAAQADAKAALQALDDFDRRNGIHDLSAQRLALTQRIELLERNLLDSRISINRLSRSRAFLRTEIDATKKEPAQLLAGEPSAEYVRLQGERTALRFRLLDLEPRTGETGEDLAARRALIEKAMAEVEHQLEKSGQFPMTPNGPRQTRLDQLQARLDVAEETFVGLEKSTEGQEAQLREAKEKLKALIEAAPEHDALTAALARRNDLAQSLNASLARIGMMEMLTDQQLGNLQILEPAVIPVEKAGPQRSKYLLLGAVVGLALGLLGSFLRSSTDLRLQRPSELRVISRKAILAVARQQKEAPNPSHMLTGSGPGELASPVLLGDLWASLVSEERKPRGVAFVGCASGVGCSTAALAAAVGLARNGSRVLFATDRDFIKQCTGLEVADGDSGRRCETAQPTLWMLPLDRRPGVVGGHDPIAMGAEAGVDYVVIDLGCPDVRPETAGHLANADAAVLVAAAGIVRKPDVRRWLHLIGKCGTELLGAVFNRYRSSRPFWLPGEDPELYVN